MATPMQSSALTLFAFCCGAAAQEAGHSHDVAATQAVASPAARAAAIAPVLDLAGARRVATTAVLEATRRGAPGAAIAITDSGGNLLYLERLDGTFPMAATVSTGKARTAALFQKPTRVFETAINGGRTAMAALRDFTPLQGGVPIRIDGHVVGAIGVSGAASAEQDDQIAEVGAAVFAATAPAMAECCQAAAAPSRGQVVHLEAGAVRAAFAAGAPLLEVADFKVHASRRDAAGQAEVHEDETDVIYVLGGKAEFVVGGKVVAPETTAPHEIRGSAIADGTTHELQQGDVFVVPRGVPHWFKRVDAPFTYYVVKVVHGSHGD